MRKIKRPKLSRPRRYSSHASAFSVARSAEFFLLVVGKLEPQAFENRLRDPILQRQNIAALGVDAVAPKNIAGHDVEQLRRHAQFVAGTYKSGRENGVNTQLAPGFARIDLFALIFCDHRARPHDDRANLRKLGDDGVGESEFVKISVAGSWPRF